MRLARLGLVLAVALLAVPASAGADTVTSSSNNYTFTDDPGEASTVTMTAGPGSVVFAQAGGDPISESLGTCTGTGTATVTCTDPALNIGILNLGDMVDHGTANGSRGGSIDGGPGDDVLVGSNTNSNFEDVFGGTGNDKINTRNVGPSSSPFNDVGDFADGDSGADQIVTGNGNDIANGEGQEETTPGADAISTGSGYDEASGGPGNGDRVNLGSGDDEAIVQAGDGSGDVYDGSAGIDKIVGRSDFPGPPNNYTVDLAAGRITKTNAPSFSVGLVSIEDAQTTEGPSLVGGDISGNDALIGTGGPNELAGGDGNDVFSPGGGADRVIAGDGNDSMDLSDGAPDTGLCGLGNDSAHIDQFDVTSDCEHVKVSRLRPADAERTPPKCKLRKVKSRYSTKSFVKGLRPRLTCNEAVSLLARLVVRVRSVSGRVKTSRAGDLVLAERSAKLGGATRSLRLKPSRKLVRRLGKSFKARLVLEARDQFGNRRVVKKTVRVKAAKKKKTKRRRR